MTTLAIIGRGKWGSRYIEEIKKIPEAELKYVVTRNYKELHNYSDVDGIIIATPDYTHADIIKEFPNKFLLVEKPLTTSLIRAQEISNSKTMVGHIYLYNQNLMERLKQVKDIQYFNFRLCNTNRVEKTTPLWHLAPHGISLCVHLFGEPKYTKVWKINGNIFIKLKYKNTDCLIEIGWNYLTKSRAIIALGDGGLYFDDSEKQKISPLENEIRAFIKFTKGEGCITGLDHALKVEKILDNVEKMLAMQI